MIDMVENYFPQGIATGNAFIGRDKDMEWLIKNIQTGHHTLLLAPRRYGKTSLAVNTLSKLHLPFAEVNCYLALSASAVEKKILAAVQSLLKKTVGKPEKILTSVQSFLKKGKKRWTLGFKGVLGVEITPDSSEDYPENILTALMLVEDVLNTQKKQAIIFIDEVQEIDALKESRQVEAAIRQFAQQSKRLVFIFSGSNRRLLTQMFDDRLKPLYELCDRIILDRISVEDYRKYLNYVAEKTFKKNLPENVFSTIIQLSERHPKRIYNLCFYLWRICQEANKIPNADDVFKAWDIYLKQRLKDTQYHLTRLSPGQLKVLTLAATGASKEMTGQIAQKRVKMAGSSIVQALQSLEAGDYIEKTTDNIYRLVDPLIKDTLLKYEIVNLD